LTSAWLGRPSLGRRIAIAMVLSLFAIQAQAFLQIRLLSSPEFRLTGTRWLAKVTTDAARQAFAVPAEQRARLLQMKFGELPLAFEWTEASAPHFSVDGASAATKQLRATLRDMLGDDARQIKVSAALNLRFPMNSVRLTIHPEEIGSQVGAEPLRAGMPEVLIPAGIQIAIAGRDGSWLIVRPIGFDDGALGSMLPFAPLFAGGLIIVLVSTLMARRMVAPLDRLVQAAERIGTAREPVRVETAGLHEFSAVARAFEDMQQRLLRFVDDRTQMLAAISHDLRSSLTRLRLAAEQCPGAEEKAALSAEIDDMQAILDSTLAFASGEARAAPSQSTDIGSLLISIVDEAVDSGHRCTYQGPDHIETMAHPVSLKRACRNVVDNAIKYGTCARVSLVVEEARLLIVIEDDGPGIVIENQEEVFKPFRRLDAARSSQTPGAGLGLTIARDVIQSHGGTIVLSNRPGGGLTVAMQLPRS
jgi:signal transduction histidine kinase